MGRTKKQRLLAPECTTNVHRSMIPTATAAAVARNESISWASLPEDLVLQLAWRVLAGDFLGYVRFRAVCSNWRSATVSPRGRGVLDQRFHPRRWMMVPEGHGLHPGHGKLRGWVRFFNLDTGTYVRVRLDLFKNHCVLDSVDGLLLLQRDDDTVIRLLHPFTGDMADLPPLATLHPQVDPLLIGAYDEKHRWTYLRSVDASSCSINAAGVITVMLALNTMQRVAFATSQGQQWTLSSWKLPDCCTQLSFKGKLYVVSNNSYIARPQILQLDPPLQEGILPPPKLIATCEIDRHALPIYLVGFNSEVLVVRCRSDPGPPIAVYKLSDVVLGRLIPLKSIGDNAIFIGATTLSVSTKVLTTLVRNTVVYRRTCDYVAQYHLGSETLSPALDDCDLNGCAPSPFSLVRLIFTCCLPRLWNKGLIHCPKSYPLKFNWKVKGTFRYGSKSNSKGVSPHLSTPFVHMEKKLTNGGQLYHGIIGFYVPRRSPMVASNLLQLEEERRLDLHLISHTSLQPRRCFVVLL